MMEMNPSYLAFLEGLNEIDKAQLLHGNWDARPRGANYFERDWLQVVDSVPIGAKCCRAYDFAATERSQVNKSPDATTSCKMYKDRDGYFTLAGEYHESFIDDETAVMGRVCKRVGDRDKVVIKQAHYDGSDCIIVSPIDPAAAGKQVFTEFAKKMAGEGFTVKKDPVPNNRAKLQRFLPFADSAENGLIRIAKNTFDPVTYEFIMKELEAFDGERSSGARHDDFPDCIASAYNFLCTSKVRGRFSGSGLSSGSSKLSAHKSRIQ
ncbi:terminase-like family protein [Vibrio phage 1.187.O._10N.286.49.F1]|nr:terminase-like family protein [Vibrio phage 1.187.O._10N.286.49.F1]